MKLVSVHTSFWQIQTLRSLGNIVIVVLLAATSGGLMLLAPRNTFGVLLRATLLAICMFFFFGGAPHLSVAQMASGLYTYPLFVCLLAGPVLKERIGVWRISSMLLGAAGALLILSPWQAGFSAVQLMPVIAGFFFACNILCLRKLCRVLLTIFPLPAEAVSAMPFIAIAWPALTLPIVAFAVVASMLNLTGNICMTRAYQTADASLLAPLDFTYLIFATIWGKLIFNQWPTGLPLFGIVLIVTAGVTIAWREQISKKINP